LTTTLVLIDHGVWLDQLERHVNSWPVFGATRHREERRLYLDLVRVTGLHIWADVVKVAWLVGGLCCTTVCRPVRIVMGKQLTQLPLLVLSF